jgi:hypothetical protein
MPEARKGISWVAADGSKVEHIEDRIGRAIERGEDLPTGQVLTAIGYVRLDEAVTRKSRLSDARNRKAERGRSDTDLHGVLLKVRSGSDDLIRAIA